MSQDSFWNAEVCNSQEARPWASVLILEKRLENSQTDVNYVRLLKVKDLANFFGCLVIHARSVELTSSDGDVIASGQRLAGFSRGCRRLAAFVGEQLWQSKGLWRWLGAAVWLAWLEEQPWSHKTCYRFQWFARQSDCSIPWLQQVERWFPGEITQVWFSWRCWWKPRNHCLQSLSVLRQWGSNYFLTEGDFYFRS